MNKNKNKNMSILSNKNYNDLLLSCFLSYEERKEPNLIKVSPVGAYISFENEKNQECEITLAIGVPYILASNKPRNDISYIDVYLWYNNEDVCENNLYYRRYEVKNNLKFFDYSTDVFIKKYHEICEKYNSEFQIGLTFKSRKELTRLIKHWDLRLISKN